MFAAIYSFALSEPLYIYIYHSMMCSSCMGLTCLCQYNFGRNLSQHGHLTSSCFKSLELAAFLWATRQVQGLCNRQLL